MLRLCLVALLALAVSGRSLVKRSASPSSSVSSSDEELLPPPEFLALEHLSLCDLASGELEDLEARAEEEDYAATLYLDLYHNHCLDYAEEEEEDWEEESSSSELDLPSEEVLEGLTYCELGPVALDELAAAAEAVDPEEPYSLNALYYALYADYCLHPELSTPLELVN